MAAGAVRGKCRRAAPTAARVCDVGVATGCAAAAAHGGQREVFFDDTQLEVSGKHFEVAALN